MSDGMMVLLIFAIIIVVPALTVFLILASAKARRKKKIETYTGSTQGLIEKISTRGVDAPWIIYVAYRVDGVEYRIRETAKLKSETIRLGKIPIGQKKTFVLGPVREGDFVTIKYDLNNPAKAIILGNEGLMTG